MKQACKAVFCFFVLSFLCVGCAKKAERRQGLTIKDGALTVGVEIGYPPMEYYDTDGKTLIGFDIELAKALAETLGLQVDYIDVAWEAIMPGLDANRYDMAINITILPVRQAKYNFTRPYIDSSITIAALKDSGFAIEKPEDIAGYSVCYQVDTTAQYFTERLSEQGVGFTSYSYDKILNCFDDLSLKRVDLVVVDNIVAFDYAGKENSPYEVIWQGPSDEYIGICLKKGNDALTNALNNALDELFENGTMLQISQKIFNRDLVSPVR
ncbi:MAG: ABC transporter substrate-binding protein [Treponema sp.]|jgi:polar amino acid transport system substrate-binding protein|nr:ABC transporter substrate-binding protein [Treponema sp.]